jgi:hypothetical protein
MTAPLAAATLLALAAGQEAQRRLDRLRPRLEARSAAERAQARAELRRILVEEDAGEALAALESWPLAPALELRAVLLDLPLLRAELLRSCFDPERGELARALLVEAFRARADSLAPFRAELDSASGRRLPWADHGVWVRRAGPPREPLDPFEVRRTLAREGSWTQPVILFPGSLEEGIPAPLPERAPAEAWLEIELLRRGLVPLRGAIATWMVPRSLAPEGDSEEVARGGRELLRRFEREQSLLEAALLALRSRPDFERGRLGCDLLAQLGLPCVPPRSLDGDFARGVCAASTCRGDPEPSEPPNRDGAAETPGLPAATEPLSTAQLREAMAACADRLVSGEGALESTRAALRDLVDGHAGRLALEPLLGGELSGLVRQRAAAQPAESPARAALEQASEELFLLGRSSRPGTRLIELPRGRGSR